MRATAWQKPFWTATLCYKEAIMANRKNSVMDAATIRIFVEMAALLTAIIVLLVLIGNVNSGSGAQQEDPT